MNFRYPLAPPTTSVPNPFVVEFDYLPHALHYPLTPQEDRDLYVTRITVSAAAAAAGADRIAHVFPRTNVRFLMTDSGGLTLAVLALRYLDASDTEPLPIRGVWISLGLPGDVRGIRTAAGHDLFPTAVIYHDVIVDRTIVQQSIIPLLEAEKVTSTDATGQISEITDIRSKLIVWLNGETGVSFPDVDNLPATFASRTFQLPRIPVVGGDHSLSVTAMMLDGTRMELNTLHEIIDDLKTNLSAGSLLRDARWLIHIPVSYIYLVLPPSELAPGHTNHPLALVWPASPALWSVLVFSFGDAGRGNITELLSDGKFTRLTCQINAEAEFPVDRTGLFFFRTAQATNTVKLFQQPLHDQKFLSLFTSVGQPLTGSTISLTDVLAPQGVYRIVISDTPAPIVGSGDHYFGVPTQLDQLQAFISAVSARHMILLTTAGAFARTMGYLAEAVSNHVGSHPVDRIFGRVLIPPSASFLYMLGVACRLLMTDQYRTGIGLETSWLTVGLVQRAEIDLSSVETLRPQWMNNHEDGRSGSGWKVFVPASNDMSGRKDHFLFNCALRVGWCNAHYNLGVGIFNVVTDEDDETDKVYNEKGEEFAEWGLSSDYRPEQVEQWILTNLVERGVP